MPPDALTGRLLVATPLLAEPPFARTVVVVLDHDAGSGALGVVLNRPLDLPGAAALPAVADLLAPPAVLYDGGPVGPNNAIALGAPRPGAQPDGWTLTAPPLATVDLDHDPALLAAGLDRVRVFIGYAGWSAGQLEGEVAEGAWYVVDGEKDDAFTDEPESLWTRVLRRQGWPLAAVASYPLDPTMN